MEHPFMLKERHKRLMKTFKNRSNLMKVIHIEPTIKQVFDDDSPSKKRRQNKNPLISCLIPVYNEAENIAILIPALCEYLAKLSSRYEIVIIDDGSHDNSAKVAIALSVSYPVKVLQLSRNFGKENALTAGIDHSQGDVILILDADFQHPLEMIPKFFELWRQGYDMVYGVRTNRNHETFIKRLLTKGFYRLLTLGSNTPLEENAGDFRLMDYCVAEALRGLPERSRFMKGLYGWVGFKSKAVPFEVGVRKIGKSKYNLLHLAKLAITGITSFSTLPLHISSFIGVLVSIFSIFYGLIIATKTLFFGVDLPGWATLAVGMTFLGGIQLLSIGILGEYIAKIFTEAKARPPYLIRFRHDIDSLDIANHNEHQA